MQYAEFRLSKTSDMRTRTVRCFFFGGGSTASALQTKPSTDAERVRHYETHPEKQCSNKHSHPTAEYAGATEPLCFRSRQHIAATLRNILKPMPNTTIYRTKRYKPRLRVKMDSDDSTKAHVKPCHHQDASHSFIAFIPFQYLHSRTSIGIL